MNCPRCTVLLGLLAAAMLPQHPRITTAPGCAAGMHAVNVEALQLHYTRNGSQAEAERVAAWLNRENLHTEYPGTMRLDRVNDAYLVALTASSAATEPGSRVRQLQRLASRLSEAVLNGLSVSFSVRDPGQHSVEVIAPAEDMAFLYF